MLHERPNNPKNGSVIRGAVRVSVGGLWRQPQRCRARVANIRVAMDAGSDERYVRAADRSAVLSTNAIDQSIESGSETRNERARKITRRAVRNSSMARRHANRSVRPSQRRKWFFWHSRCLHTL